MTRLNHRNLIGVTTPLVLLMAGATGAAAQEAAAHPLGSPIFGDHMVLQREKPDPIWGWSQPGDKVRVEIGGNSAMATAGADGEWEAKIQPPAAGGPYTLKIAGTHTVELQDVLVGDVWICAGQSHMQFGLAQARNAAEEIKNANYPQMRFFVVGLVSVDIRSIHFVHLRTESDGPSFRLHHGGYTARP